jgi:hypothetical protein
MAAAAEIAATAASAGASTAVVEAIARSVFETGWTAQPGDTVILYYAINDMVPVTLSRGGSFHGHGGVYMHDDMIGVPFGSRVSKRGRPERGCGGSGGRSAAVPP